MELVALIFLAALFYLMAKFFSFPTVGDEKGRKRKARFFR